MTKAPGIWICMINIIHVYIYIHVIYIYTYIHNVFGSFLFSLVEHSGAKTAAVRAQRVSLSFRYVLLVVTKYARWCDSRDSTAMIKNTLANMNRFLSIKWLHGKPQAGTWKETAGFQFVYRFGSCQSPRPACVHHVHWWEHAGWSQRASRTVEQLGCARHRTSCPETIRNHSPMVCWRDRGGDDFTHFSTFYTSLYIFIRCSCRLSGNMRFLWWECVGRRPPECPRLQSWAHLECGEEERLVVRCGNPGKIKESKELHHIAPEKKTMKTLTLSGCCMPDRWTTL